MTSMQKEEKRRGTRVAGSSILDSEVVVVVVAVGGVRGRRGALGVAQCT